VNIAVWAGALLLASVAWGQIWPEELQKYLRLTNQQMGALSEANVEFHSWKGDKLARIYTVQQEISEETAKSPLNPVALGIRYAEIEAICREVRERAEKLQKANGERLNEEQRARLKVLEDAWKLVGLSVSHSQRI
jgi:hypothetical protein